MHDKTRRFGKAAPTDEDDKVGKKAKKPIGKGGKKKGRLAMNDMDDSRRKSPRLRSGLPAALKIDNKHTFQRAYGKESLGSCYSRRNLRWRAGSENVEQVRSGG